MLFLKTWTFKTAAKSINEFQWLNALIFLQPKANYTNHKINNRGIKIKKEEHERNSSRNHSSSICVQILLFSESLIRCAGCCVQTIFAWQLLRWESFLSTVSVLEVEWHLLSPCLFAMSFSFCSCSKLLWTLGQLSSLGFFDSHINKITWLILQKCEGLYC